MSYHIAAKSRNNYASTDEYTRTKLFKQFTHVRQKKCLPHATKYKQMENGNFLFHETAKVIKSSTRVCKLQ
jgi:hypothetical protein